MSSIYGLTQFSTWWNAEYLDFEHHPEIKELHWPKSAEKLQHSTPRVGSHWTAAHFCGTCWLSSAIHRPAFQIKLLVENVLGHEIHLEKKMQELKSREIHLEKMQWLKSREICLKKKSWKSHELSPGSRAWSNHFSLPLQPEDGEHCLDIVKHYQVSFPVTFCLLRLTTWSPLREKQSPPKPRSTRLPFCPLTLAASMTRSWTDYIGLTRAE